MTTPTIVTPGPTVPRDRWQRPLVIPVGGGKPVPYTRATTYVGCVEDTFNLQKWMQRMVSLGLAARPDLLLSVNAHRDDKRELDRICDAAREHAGASAKATTGTALHALTELVDRGQKLPDGLPISVVASLDAYRDVTAPLKLAKGHIETFTVQDPLKIGGTPDRISDRIVDLKTGSIEWGFVKIAAQLAVYSRSALYDIATGERTPHGASTTEGVVVHLPAVDDAADATCTLYTVDLTAGWQAVKVAEQVRAQRALKFAELMVPLGSAKPATPVEVARAAKVDEHAAFTALADAIRACRTRDAVTALWAERQAEWTDDATFVAKTHLAALPVAS